MYEKIIQIYPELATYDFASGVITLQNDGQGDYIAKWEHTLAKPTDEQLGIAPAEEVIETPAETAPTEGTE
jgi:hypothetical protein